MCVCVYVCVGCVCTISHRCLFGCLVVWLLVVWLFGCLVVCLCGAATHASCRCCSKWLRSRALTSLSAAFAVARLSALYVVPLLYCIACLFSFVCFVFALCPAWWRGSACSRRGLKAQETRGHPCNVSVGLLVTCEKCSPAPAPCPHPIPPPIPPRLCSSLSQGILGSSVSKEAFRKDAIEVMRLMASEQATGAMDSSDPQRSCMWTTWGRIAAVLRQDFVPYLPTVMPGLLAAAAENPMVQKLTAAQVAAEAELAADSDDSEVDTFEGVRGVNVGEHVCVCGWGWGAFVCLQQQGGAVLDVMLRVHFASSLLLPLPVSPTAPRRHRLARANGSFGRQG